MSTRLTNVTASSNLIDAPLNGQSPRHITELIAPITDLKQNETSILYTSKKDYLPVPSEGNFNGVQLLANAHRCICKHNTPEGYAHLAGLGQEK